MSRARILADYVSSGDELADKLDLSGGAMTGAITTNSTFDGVDVATRDAIHAPKASPAFTGTPTGITAAHILSGALPSVITGSPTLDLANVTGTRTGAHTYAQWQDCNGYGTYPVGSTIIKFATQDVASNDTVVTVDNSGTYGFTVVANMNCYAFLSFTATGTGAGRNFGFTLGASVSERSEGINTIDSLACLSSVDTADASNGMQTSCAVYMSSGNIIRMQGDGGAYDTSYTYRQKLTIFAIEAV